MSKNVKATVETCRNGCRSQKYYKCLACTPARRAHTTAPATRTLSNHTAKRAGGGGRRRGGFLSFFVLVLGRGLEWSAAVAIGPLVPARGVCVRTWDLERSPRFGDRFYSGVMQLRTHARVAVPPPLPLHRPHLPPHTMPVRPPHSPPRLAPSQTGSCLWLLCGTAYRARPSHSGKC